MKKLIIKVQNIMRLKNCFVIGMILFLLTACTSTVRLYVTRPAEISIQPHINKIAVINRTKPSSKVMNVIEGVITGEGIHQDAEASQETISGFIRILKGSPRYEVIRTGIRLKGSKTGKMFKSPIGWHQIRQYCKKFSADAIVALEIFDTDFIVTDGKKVVPRKDENQKEYNETVYTAEGVASVKVGFRIYDPRNKEIVDEKVFMRRNEWIAEGTSVKDAIAHLINRKNAIKQVSGDIGEVYGYKICPVRVTVKRMMYKRSRHSPEIAIGCRRADVDDWKGAAKEWKKAVKSSHMKTSGKAAYNLALAYEVLGNFEKAVHWAQKSYTDYGNKDARRYVHIIKQRILEEKRLKQQIGE